MSTDSILAPVAALQIPDVASAAARAQQALAFIEQFPIDSSEAFELAGDELRSVKAKINALEAQRTTITGPLHKAMTAVNALFKGPADLLARGESLWKSKMLAYESEQERIAAEARRVAEEAAAVERQRLEEEAAARQREAQAQADAAAAAQRAQAEAQAAADAAAAAGNADAAAAAQREVAAQAQAAQMAQAATQRAQAEAQTATTTAQLTTASVLAVAAPKASGVITSKKIEFEVTDLHALVRHIAAHPELLSLVVADSVRLRAYVKGLGTACALPGVRVYEAKVMSARAAA